MSTTSVRPSRKTPPPEISAISPPLTPPHKSFDLPNDHEDRPVDIDIPDNYVEHTIRATKPLPPISGSNFWTEINWLNVIILTMTPVLTAYGFWTVKLYWKTAIFSVMYYYFTGLGKCGD